VKNSQAFFFTALGRFFMSENQEALVDIVYLWVDGGDPVWRRKRARAAATLSAHERQKMALYGNVEGRFRDNDELRYSLRAVDRFFPNHGHIYLVTDGQTPGWLQASSQITLVDHRELIPAKLLPTFDSGNIESYIHRIPGLSERFFYLNDDVFFGAPVKLDDWFYPGGTYVAWSDEPAISNEPMRADATALDNACRLSHAWLTDRSTPTTGGTNAGYQPVFRTFAHSPRPMLRSRMAQLEQLAPELFERVRSTVFRVWDKPTIVSDFVMRWALANNQARVCEHSHLYVAAGAGDSHALAEVLAELVEAVGGIDFFCINDTTDNSLSHDPRLLQIRQALDTVFAQASPFERSQSPVLELGTACANADQLMSVA
jgi:hypothetical protein